MYCKYFFFQIEKVQLCKKFHFNNYLNYNITPVNHKMIISTSNANKQTTHFLKKEI